MKKTTKFLVTLLFMVIVLICNGQVSEIGLYFKKNGFIRSINPVKNELLVTFVEKNIIETQVVTIINSTANKLAIDINLIHQLKVGMQVEIEGDYFQKKKVTYANKLKLKNKRKI